MEESGLRHIQFLNSDVTWYSKTPIYRAPIYRKPRFTAANFSPQIGLNMHIVNKQNPDPPRTPIYREFLPAPKTRGKLGFYCII